MKKKAQNHDRRPQKADQTRKLKAERLDEVLRLRAEGHGYREIGRTVDIHPTTVKNWCNEIVEEMIDPRAELQSRIRQVTTALDKALLKFNPEEVTAAGLVALMTYADKITGLDRHLNSMQPTEAMTLLTIHLSGGDDLELDKPEDYPELESALN